MPASAFRYDRTVPLFTAANRHTTAEIVAEAAQLALDTAHDMPNTGRRFLSEAKRPDYSIRRARMFQWWDEFYEWIAYAPREVATLPAEMIRGIIVAHQPTAVACLATAIGHENKVAFRSDEFERWYLLEKTLVRIDGVIHGWNSQIEATRLGLDIAHATRARQSVSLPS